MITITVTTRHHLRSLIVTPAAGSSVDLLGAPDEQTVDKTSVIIANPASSTEISLPCHWAADTGKARMKVTVEGEGFARTSPVLEADDSAPQFWFA